MPELVLKSISKRYGDVQALEEINLEIKDGEFCVIVGPSGSGKTTLLNIIAGFIKPDKGEVIVAGKPFTHLNPRERNIGMVFQDIGLFSHMSVRKNIAFGLEIKSQFKKDIDRRVEEIARRLKIEKLLDKNPRILSGGEAQRVAIGRTLITEPSFFLFDEPLGNLDANLRAEMLTEIKKLHMSLKKTFIYVTHDQEQALSAATLVVIMNNGKILQTGHPKEIYNRPENIFVAEFYGVSPMNLIDGVITPQQEGTFFTGAGLYVNIKGYHQLEKLNVTLGIRPADIIILEDKNSGDGSGIINSVETLGDKNQLYITLEQEKIILAISSPKTRPQTGKKVRIKLKEDKIFLFDRKSGWRLYP